jgi:hypothetical protein
MRQKLIASVAFIAFAATLPGGVSNPASAADIVKARPAKKAPVAAEPPQTGWTLCRKPATPEPEPKHPEVPGDNIFGFTDPTDLGNPGDCGVSFEYTGSAGKADGRYRFGTLKSEFSATVADNLMLAIAPFVTFHNIRNVTGLDDTSQGRFDGLSGELAYRFLERSATNRFAATVAVEPRWARVDGLSGAGATGYSVEFKLFVDAVIVAEKLYAALNLNYAPATQKLNNDPLGEWTRSAGTNVSGALTYQVNNKFFLGLEARALGAYEGAGLGNHVGHAVFFGPTMLVKLSETVALNAVWTPQIYGRADGSDRRLDLDNFERHQFRVKLAKGF